MHVIVTNMTDATKVTMTKVEEFRRSVKGPNLKHHDFGGTVTVILATESETNNLRLIWPKDKEVSSQLVVDYDSCATQLKCVVKHRRYYTRVSIFGPLTFHSTDLWIYNLRSAQT